MSDFNDRYKSAEKYLSKYKSLPNFEDLKQSVALKLWEYPNEDVAKVCKIVVKNLYKEEYKHFYKRAKSIYNNDGECLDDNLYFVDQNTVEKFGETHNITEDIEDNIAKLEKTLQVIDSVCYGRTTRDGISLRTIRGRTAIKQNLRFQSLINNFCSQTLFNLIRR